MLSAEYLLLYYTEYCIGGTVLSILELMRVPLVAIRGSRDRGIPQLKVSKVPPLSGATHPQLGAVAVHFTQFSFDLSPLFATGDSHSIFGVNYEIRLDLSPWILYHQQLS